MGKNQKFTYASLRERYIFSIKKYHFDVDKSPEALEKLKEILIAHKILLDEINSNFQETDYQGGNMPKIALAYKEYEANLNQLKDVSKYYPRLSMKKYLEMYAMARDKGLEVNEIIGQYTRRQENRDSTNKHYDISFERYFLLYIKYVGLIDLDGYIDQYATGGKQILKQTGLFNKKTVPMNLEEFLNLKVKKKNSC